LFLLSDQKKKKGKEKDKDIPCVMCITNDDATRNGSKYNDAMKKKNVQRGGKKQKKKEMMKML
jgi:hypothetical protein